MVLLEFFEDFILTPHINYHLQSCVLMKYKVKMVLQDKERVLLFEEEEED